ncbi:MAG: glycosyltransferase family 39 protein [bacterium]|nr:glycosyltransferase family 39 protein [bacterium]
MNSINPDPSTGFNRQTKIHLVILFLLCGILFFSGLESRSLWDIDEGMHAATSKDMVLTGDWITPMLNGERFDDKPVMFPWLVALSFVVFGFSEFAARFPSALMGLATVLVTYALGRRIFNPRAAFLGAVVLATSIEFLVMSTVVVHDVVLTFFVTAGIYCWWRAFESDRGRLRWMVLFYVAAGLSVLTKGPLGLVLLFLATAPFLLVEKRLSFIKKMAIPLGAVVILLVAGPWYVAMMLRHEGYAAYFFIQQNLMNFASSTPRHPEPFYYYIAPLLGGLFPWSGFLPVAVWNVFKERAGNWGQELRFMLLWLVAIFLFFSAASSKIPSYLMPLLPAAALLIGVAWERMVDDPNPARRKWFLWSQLLPLALISAGLGYYTIVRLDEFIATYDLELYRYYLPIGGLFGGVLISALLFVIKRYRASFTSLAVMVVVLIVSLQILIFPTLNSYRTTVELGAQLDELLQPGERMVHYKRLFDSVLYYTSRHARVEEDSEALVALFAGDDPAYCIIRRMEFERIEELQGISRVIGTEGNKYLITNQILE